MTTRIPTRTCARTHARTHTHPVHLSKGRSYRRNFTLCAWFRTWYDFSLVLNHVQIIQIVCSTCTSNGAFYPEGILSVIHPCLISRLLWCVSIALPAAANVAPNRRILRSSAASHHDPANLRKHVRSLCVLYAIFSLMFNNKHFFHLVSNTSNVVYTMPRTCSATLF